MPNLHSALKRVRLAEKARVYNRAVRSKVTSTRRKSFEAFEGKDKGLSQTAFQEYCSVLDRAAKRGVIPRNTAIRRKRRAAARLAKVVTPVVAPTA